MPLTFFKSNSKITPDQGKRKSNLQYGKVGRRRIAEKPAWPLKLVKLSTVFERFGGGKSSLIDSYDTLKARGEIIDSRHTERDAVLIYVSHEWVGIDHPDPDGVQLRHLLVLLKRLQNGQVKKTEMDAFHRLLYKHNHTTTAEEWKRTLNPDKTYIFYDVFCVPQSKREETFRSIPAYIERCDFVIILAPGCTHSLTHNAHFVSHLHPLQHHRYSLR